MVYRLRSIYRRGYIRYPTYREDHHVRTRNGLPRGTVRGSATSPRLARGQGVPGLELGLGAIAPDPNPGSPRVMERALSGLGRGLVWLIKDPTRACSLVAMYVVSGLAIGHFHPNWF